MIDRGLSFYKTNVHIEIITFNYKRNTIDVGIVHLCWHMF